MYHLLSMYHLLAGTRREKIKASLYYEQISLKSIWDACS